MSVSSLLSSLSNRSTLLSSSSSFLATLSSLRLSRPFYNRSLSSRNLLRSFSSNLLSTSLSSLNQLRPFFCLNLLLLPLHCPTLQFKLSGNLMSLFSHSFNLTTLFSLPLTPLFSPPPVSKQFNLNAAQPLLSLAAPTVEGTAKIPTTCLLFRREAENRSRKNSGSENLLTRSLTQKGPQLMRNLSSQPGSALATSGDTVSECCHSFLSAKNLTT